MIFKEFKDIKLSRLGMGNMRLPIIPGGKDTDIDYVAGQALIDKVYEAGVNYYDSAYVYHGGKSEVFLGKALKKYPRDSYYITTKYNVSANPDYKATFKEQLERFEVDYIDFYLIHCVMDSNVDKYLENGCIDFFLDMQKEGKIKYLGFSSHGSPATLEKMASHHNWDFAQIQLNYFDWLYGTAKDEYEILVNKNIPIMVMESIRGGKLAKLSENAEELLRSVHPDWSTASWGFRWLKSLSGVQVALSGMTYMENVIDNLNTYADDYALNEEETATLFKACELFHEHLSVPCTGCKYCVDGCPMNIDIPSYLEAYNDYKINGWMAINKLKNLESAGKASDCIGCGQCLAHCPQSIDTPNIMVDIAKVISK